MKNTKHYKQYVRMNKTVDGQAKNHAGGMKQEAGIVTRENH